MALAIHSTARYMIFWRRAFRVRTAVPASAASVATSVWPTAPRAKPGKPSDESLTACLTNKPMIIRVAMWEMDDRETGGKVRGNWVQAVAPKSKGIDVKPAAAVKPATASKAAAAVDDDEVPF